MRHFLPILVLIGVVSLLALVACAGSDSEPSESRSVPESTGQSKDSESDSGESESGEHGGNSESGESGEGPESGEGGEESGAQYMPGDTYDEVRAGARLVLSYDSAANTFTGTVENTTWATLSRVRVEVHLSNGTELGPTTPVDLAPGQSVGVTLPATSQPFTSWSAHPEVG